jgi:hypothetical protein
MLLVVARSVTLDRVGPFAFIRGRLRHLRLILTYAPLRCPLCMRHRNYAQTPSTTAAWLTACGKPCCRGNSASNASGGR